MVSRKQTFIWFSALLTTFLLGGVTGGLVSHRWQQAPPAPEEIKSDRPRPERSWGLQALQKRLKLDEVQSAQVAEILQRSRAEASALRKQFQPGLSEILTRSRQEIREVLREEQVERFDQMLSREEQFQRDHRPQRERGERERRDVRPYPR
ncbi:MAG: hypothetical protein ACFCU3_11775 [Verrucomicrobiales bacterium]